MNKEWWKHGVGVQTLSCMPFSVMEPYVMVRRDPQTPLYDAFFINYGYNKVEFIMELQASGYFFYPLTGVFGFDAPHLE